MNPSTPAPPEPRFPWFSKGVLLLALIGLWLYWALSQPDKPGHAPVPIKTQLEGYGFLLALAILWQWIRYADFKKRVADGTYGQPSAWKRLFSPKPTYIGSKGGQYTISKNGNKVYKRR